MPEHSSRITLTRILLLTVASMIALLLCVVAAFFARDQANKRMFLARVEQLRSAGHPVDDASLAKAYYARTDSTNTDKWLKIFQDHSALEKSVPKAGVYLITYDANAPFVAVGDWPHDAATRQYLDQYQSLLNDLRNLARHRKPVQFPRKFESFNTSLEEESNARQLGRLVLVDGYMSIRDQQPQRLLDDILTLFNLADAVENGPWFIAGVFANGLESDAVSLIDQTLMDSALGTSELESLLVRLLEEAKHVPQWQRMVREQRASMLAIFFDSSMLGDLLGDHRSPLVESLPLRGRDGIVYLDYMDTAESILAENLDELLAKASQIERDFYAGHQSYISNIELLVSARTIPSLRDWATMFVGRENKVRTATYAVACKLYMLEHGKAPDSLASLDLPHTELVLSGGKPPGYRVTDSGGVLLWHFDLEKDQSTPDEPPPPRLPESIAPESFLWSIPSNATLDELEITK